MAIKNHEREYNEKAKKCVCDEMGQKWCKMKMKMQRKQLLFYLFAHWSVCSRKCLSECVFMKMKWCLVLLSTRQEWDIPNSIIIIKRHRHLNGNEFICYYRCYSCCSCFLYCASFNQKNNKMCKTMCKRTWCIKIEYKYKI